MFSNQIFNVNGIGDKMLGVALDLAFMQNGEKTTAAGFTVMREYGLILHWTDSENSTQLMAKLDSQQCLPLVIAWLASKPELDYAGDDEFYAHDGSNEVGWRVHNQWGEWSPGKIHPDFTTICAIRPTWIQYGK